MAQSIRDVNVTSVLLSTVLSVRAAKGRRRGNEFCVPDDKI